MSNQSLHEVAAPLAKSVVEVIGDVAIFSESTSNPIYNIAALILGGTITTIGFIRGVVTVGSLEQDRSIS